MLRLEYSYQNKGKRYLHNLFEKWNPEHLQVHKDFNDYMENDRLRDIIGEEDI